MEKKISVLMKDVLIADLWKMRGCLIDLCPGGGGDD